MHAVFLGRGGTINVEVNYLHRPEDFAFVPGAPEAIARLNAAGLPVIVVTNQAGIARGYYGERELHALHAHMQALLAEQGAHIDAFYFCPHHPDFTGACPCRKPAPGMLLAAAADLGIDLARSWLAGHTLSDLKAARAAGCHALLVRTGYGREVEAAWTQARQAPHSDAVVDDLPAAVAFVLDRLVDHPGST